jgi:hypothetical protein
VGQKRKSPFVKNEVKLAKETMPILSWYKMGFAHNWLDHWLSCG